MEAQSSLIPYTQQIPTNLTNSCHLSLENRRTYVSVNTIHHTAHPDISSTVITRTVYLGKTVDTLPPTAPRILRRPTQATTMINFFFVNIAAVPCIRTTSALSRAVFSEASPNVRRRLDC